ncbi:hypothetical protein DPMN_038126 [Dreissena polymorpha]|uniref:Uncharacterized protein n=1 Tax=Dreissena polymorpha TaxID=45954 RepID=A0A9D4MGH9_DREPO|nr:hypothetical protein DPMN_038126 [Dreissena polymorpha]
MRDSVKECSPNTFPWVKNSHQQTTDLTGGGLLHRRFTFSLNGQTGQRIDEDADDDYSSIRLLQMRLRQK